MHRGERRECIQQDINRWIPMTNTHHRKAWLREWVDHAALPDRSSSYITAAGEVVMRYSLIRSLTTWNECLLRCLHLSSPDRYLIRRRIEGTIIPSDQSWHDKSVTLWQVVYQVASFLPRLTDIHCHCQRKYFVSSSCLSLDNEPFTKETQLSHHKTAAMD